MNLYEKLLEIQRSVDRIVKDGENKNDKYDYASGSNVLSIIRPMMNELGLLLIPEAQTATLHEGMTKSGTARYFTEMWYTMTWRDVESGEERPVSWYAQGVDLAGEKGPGKAASYAEKYFLLKFFHIPTDKDDPDNDQRTKSGELRQRGTAAAQETTAFMREAVPAMLTEMCDGDAEKIKAALVHYTKSDSRGYKGAENIGDISDAALPVVYGKVSKEYVKRTGHKWEATVE